MARALRMYTKFKKFEYTDPSARMVQMRAVLLRPQHNHLIRSSAPNSRSTTSHHSSSITWHAPTWPRFNLISSPRRPQAHKPPYLLPRLHHYLLILIILISRRGTNNSGPIRVPVLDTENVPIQEMSGGGSGVSIGSIADDAVPKGVVGRPKRLVRHFGQGPSSPWCFASLSLTGRSRRGGGGGGGRGRGPAFRTTTARGFDGWSSVHGSLVLPPDVAASVTVRDPFLMVSRFHLSCLSALRFSGAEDVGGEEH